VAHAPISSSTGARRTVPVLLGGIFKASATARRSRPMPAPAKLSYEFREIDLRRPPGLDRIQDEPHFPVLPWG
jgi:hypothetical protein